MSTMDVRLDSASQAGATRGNQASARSVPAESAAAGRSSLPTLHNASANFAYDEDSGLISIKIVNSNTGEVIRSIPSRDSVQVSPGVAKGKGLLLDARS